MKNIVFVAQGSHKSSSLYFLFLIFLLSIPLFNHAFINLMAWDKSIHYIATIFDIFFMIFIFRKSSPASFTLLKNGKTDEVSLHGRFNKIVILRSNPEPFTGISLSGENLIFHTLVNKHESNYTINTKHFPKNSLITLATKIEDTISKTAAELELDFPDPDSRIKFTPTRNVFLRYSEKPSVNKIMFFAFLTAILMSQIVQRFVL